MKPLFHVANIDATNLGNISHWVRINIQPDYEDQVMKEHLYSVDLAESYSEELPPFMQVFEKQLKAMSPDLFYFRFIFP